MVCIIIDSWLLLLLLLTILISFLSCFSLAIFWLRCGCPNDLSHYLVVFLLLLIRLKLDMVFILYIELPSLQVNMVDIEVVLV